jgi:hypothetical protein
VEDDKTTYKNDKRKVGSTDSTLACCLPERWG